MIRVQPSTPTKPARRSASRAGNAIPRSPEAPRAQSLGAFPTPRRTASSAGSTAGTRPPLGPVTPPGGGRSTPGSGHAQAPVRSRAPTTPSRLGRRATAHRRTAMLLPWAMRPAPRQVPRVAAARRRVGPWPRSTPRPRRRRTRQRTVVSAMQPSRGAEDQDRTPGRIRGVGVSVTLIYGAPCAGKTTEALRRMQPGDLLIDYDPTSGDRPDRIRGHRRRCAPHAGLSTWQTG